ncbi:MAG: hypothetical protein ACREME_00570, partial [Gemmatimonadales bacterium]
FFYWHSGFHPGPRFYDGAVPWLVIGTARAWRWGWTLGRRRRGSRVRWDVALLAAAITVLVWGWVGVLPARFSLYRTGLATLKLHPERELAARGVTQALVLVPESWGSRVIVALWELGIRPGLVERAYRQIDVCELGDFAQRARAAGLTAQEAARRLDELIAANPTAAPKMEGWPDPTLRLHRDRAPTPECERELRRDLAGFTLYGHLAWRNAIGLDSGLVFARDLYERNGELLARYPGWQVWRYAPPTGRPNARPELTLVRPATR